VRSGAVPYDFGPVLQTQGQEKKLQISCKRLAVFMDMVVTIISMQRLSIPA
jgi:hypothetical protein